ncbi:MULTISPECIES: helix-turn-helix transcriptional regulator [unclassified Micromonospora]|uniref:helix-turn-helix transcriptional regulator n=1 Tax=unclassified Micromonospora TaxID=2617518 RepID=UPI00363AD73C
MVPSGQLSPAPRTDAPPPRPDDITTLTLGGLGGLADGTDGTDWRRPVLLDADLVVLVTGGHGTAELDFRPLPCRPGTLLRVRPGQALRCEGTRLGAVVVRWSATALRGLDVEAADDVPAHRQLAGEDADAVLNEVTQLVVDCRRHPDVPAARALLRHQLAVLLLRLALLPPTPADSDAAGVGAGVAAGVGVGVGVERRAESATFRRLRHEVERGYQHTRRVEDYAARIGCSVRTLTRACLAVTGRSAKQVIDDRVALEASRLLAATDEPIARIGRRLGFPEPTNFGRFFTREMGLSPGAFRSSRGGPPGNGRPPAQRG